MVAVSMFRTKILQGFFCINSAIEFFFFKLSYFLCQLVFLFTQHIVNLSAFSDVHSRVSEAFFIGIFETL